MTRTPTAVDRGRPRLWVDRSFASAGSGTVVTGTLTGGTVRVGDEVLVAATPQRPDRAHPRGCNHSAKPTTRSAPATGPR